MNINIVSENYLRCIAPNGRGKLKSMNYGIREVKINGYN